jgi:tape measure domain-containing protein
MTTKRGGGVYVDVRGNIDPLARALDRARVAATAGAVKIGTALKTHIGNGARRAADAVLSLTKTLALLGTGAALAGGYALSRLTANFTQAAASAEAMTASLDTLTKGLGKETFAALNNWAKDMPVNTDMAIESYTRLRAMGLEPTRKDMTILVDTMSAIGGGAETLNSVARTLGQIQTKGKVSAEELMQLAEQGIPVYEILGEKLNLTKEQLGDIGRAGVDSATALSAIMQGLEDRFGGASERYMQSWDGIMESLRSTWLEFKRAVMASGPFEAMKTGLKGFLDYLATNQGQMDLRGWAQKTAVAGLEAFASLVWGVKALVTGIQTARSFWAGFVSQLKEFRLTGIQSGIDDLNRAISPESLYDKARAAFLTDEQKQANIEMRNRMIVQKAVLEKEIDYWDNLGTRAAESGQRVGRVYDQLINKAKELAKKTKPPVLFSGGSEIPGNPAGIGGGSGSGGRKSGPVAAALPSMNYDAIHMTDKERRMQFITPADVAATKQALEEIKDKGSDTADALSDAFTGWASGFSASLNDMLWEADATFRDIGRSFAKMVTQMIIQAQVVQPFVNMVNTGISGAGGWLSALFSAKGHAFDAAGVTPYAKGGAFTNAVVSKPTMFAYANGGAFGAGVMGEAGPEAVMPLTRTRSGDLGVKAAGGGTVMPKIEINIENNGRPVNAEQTEMRYDVAQNRVVCGIVLRAAANNTGGFKTSLKGLLAT